MSNLRTAYVVTPEGRLISPDSCYVVWLTSGEMNNWRSAVKEPHRYLSETVRLFGGEGLKVMNFVTSPKIAEAYRDESATAPPRKCYDLYLGGLGEMDLHVIIGALASMYARGEFEGGLDSEAGQACAKLLTRVIERMRL